LPHKGHKVAAFTFSRGSRRIAVTGATGKLGSAVVAILEIVPPSHIIASVRKPEDAFSQAAIGVEVRRGDYDEPASLLNTVLDGHIGGEVRKLVSH
jgi:uncharacterized protein YbjT (DUF2867 family)